MQPLSLAKLAYFKSLSLKKHRTEAGLFIVEGTKMVTELLRTELRIAAIVCTYGYEGIPPAHWPNAIPAYYCSDADFKKISQMGAPEGVLAIVHQPPKLSTADIPIVYPSFWLNTIQDPGNLGTIIRTADWFGFKAIYCDGDTVECYNPKVVRSSMGSLFRIPVHYLADFVAVVQTEQHNIFVTDINETSTIQQIAIKKPVGILLGNESHGVDKTISQLAGIQTISIAGSGQAESLNAAVAAGILGFWATQYHWID
jgi:RNA methyltransferase, TrmH family